MSNEYNNIGEVAEWFKAAVLKTASPKGDVSSNLTLSAISYRKREKISGKRDKSTDGVKELVINLLYVSEIRVKVTT
jgi:hypothetical protein